MWTFYLRTSLITSRRYCHDEMEPDPVGCHGSQRGQHKRDPNRCMSDQGSPDTANY